MIIIYVLAVIGGFCVLCIAGLMILIAISAKEDKEDSAEPKKTQICGLRDSPCIYEENCYCIGCPFAEEEDRKEEERRMKER